MLDRSTELLRERLLLLRHRSHFWGWGLPSAEFAQVRNHVGVAAIHRIGQRRAAMPRGRVEMRAVCQQQVGLLG